MSKSKAKKQTEGKLLKRGFPRFLWLAIPLVIAAIVAGVFLYPTGQPAPTEVLEADGEAQFLGPVLDRLIRLSHRQDVLQEGLPRFSG